MTGSTIFKRAKRSVIKMTLKGAGRRIAYGAVQNELRQGIRAVNARIREERRTLGRDTQLLSWVDWLQQQATMDDPMLLNSRASLAAALRHSCTAGRPWVRIGSGVARQVKGVILSELR